MKKIGLLLCVLMALLTASCSNILVSDGDGGSISLVIDGATAQSIRSAGALRSTTGGSSYTLTASIRGDYTATQTISSSADGLGSVTFTFERVPVGKSIILDLTATANGKYIWYGNSGKHTVKRGENQLQIAVGRVSGVLVWGDSDVKIAPYGNWDAAGTVPSEWIPPVYCYDNRGNVYIAGSNGASRFDLTKEGTYPPGPSFTGYSGTVDLIAYDNVASILYGITDTQIKKLPTSSGSDPIIDFSNKGITPEGFAVHNNIAYVADSSSSATSTVSGEEAVVNFYKYNVENKTLSSSKTITLPEVFASTNDYDSVSQMIYQEGALYLLLSRVKDSSPNIYSVGAVAKIDAETLTLDKSFGQGGYLGLVSTKRTPSYNDASGSSQKCSVYAASSSTDQVFSRPLGFVAIMPKKLVIADAGCIVYDDITSHGDYPKLKGKAVSRIVTVDLETQSLGFEDLDPYQYYWINNPLGSSVDISSGTSSSSF